MKLSQCTPKIDSHTHTILSGHAWSTLRDNVLAAKQRGLYGICLTEHSHTTPGGPPEYLPHSQGMLPDFFDGIRVYRGVEANIMVPDGSVDTPAQYLESCEFVVASIHPFFVKIGGLEENTGAYLGAIRHPHVDLIGHADDPAVPCDFEAIVGEAARLHKLIEFNNNSLSGHRPNSKPNLMRLIDTCKRMGARVCVSSDAHFETMVGNVAPIMLLLEEMNFPEALIVNMTAARFEAYLEERKRRVMAKKGIDKEG